MTTAPWARPGPARRRPGPRLTATLRAAVLAVGLAGLPAICLGATPAGTDVCGADALAALGRHLRVPALAPVADGGALITATCRPWPYQPGLLLAAIAHHGEADGQTWQTVAVIDRATLRVLRSHRSERVEDASTQVGPASFTLDTARYQLSPTQRAFGVRFHSVAHGANCADHDWHDELTLYLPQGDQLVPVLTLPMHHVRWLRGCLAATDNALMEEARLTLAVAPSRSHGLQDLVVTATIDVSGDAPGAARARTETAVLRHDGRAYAPGSAAIWWLGP